MPVLLKVLFRLFLDREDFLTVEASVFTLLAGSEPSELLHYDYERDKVGYPDAHMQIRATSPQWDALLGSASLRKLHLPVGGRRYRPAIEDLIETLIVEGIAEPQGSDWHTILETGRREFQRRQLKAAVRNDPDAAVVALKALRYRVTPPDQATVVPLKRPADGRRRKR